MEHKINTSNDPFVSFLTTIMFWIVRILSVLMVFVTLWALVDAIYHLYTEFTTSVESMFSVETIFTAIGSTLVVLICVEIFLNIVYFIINDSINVPLVLATALTAVARKVIIIDYAQVSVMHIFATAAMIFASGLTYWLIIRER